MNSNYYALYAATVCAMRFMSITLVFTMQQAERDAQRFWEPACPKCFEPFSTEAPDVDEDDDRRPVLRYARRSVCASCFCQVWYLFLILSEFAARSLALACTSS